MRPHRITRPRYLDVQRGGRGSAGRAARSVKSRYAVARARRGFFSAFVAVGRTRILSWWLCAVSVVMAEPAHPGAVAAPGWLFPVFLPAIRSVAPRIAGVGAEDAAAPAQEGADAVHLAGPAPPPRPPLSRAGPLPAPVITTTNAPTVICAATGVTRSRGLSTSCRCARSLAARPRCPNPAARGHHGS